MSDFLRPFYVFLLVEVVLILIFNIRSNLPKIPGDIYIDRPGIRIYIPFVSAIIISGVLTIYFNFFRGF